MYLVILLVRAYLDILIFFCISPLKSKHAGLCVKVNGLNLNPQRCPHLRACRGTRRGFILDLKKNLFVLMLIFL